MRRTKALILVATLAVLTSVAACSWQAEPLPAESAQSESSLSTSESATQETTEEAQKIPDLSRVPEPKRGTVCAFLNRLLHRNQNRPRVRLPNQRLRRLYEPAAATSVWGDVAPAAGVKPTARLPVTRLVLTLLLSGAMTRVFFESTRRGVSVSRFLPSRCDRRTSALRS